MEKEDDGYGLSATRRYTLRVINRLAVGSILLVWGGLLALRQAGIVEPNVSTLPFLLAAFGLLLIFGGAYRLRFEERGIDARQNLSRAEEDAAHE